MNSNSGNGPENEPLGFVDFFFFFSEMILIEKCGYFSKVATVVNRTFTSVINKILGNFLDFSHGKE